MNRAVSHRRVTAALVCATLLAIPGCADGPDKPDKPGAAPPSVAASTAATDGSSTIAPSATASSIDTSVPDVVARRLPEAEELLRRHGFLAIRTVDATGQGRTVLEKNNWVVRTQIPAAGAPASPGLTVQLKVAKPTDEQAEGTVVKGVVPNVVCKDLQSAQDALRAAGFYVLTPHDGLGQGRIALVDRNWVVVGQSVEPGTAPDLKTHIELTVVKYGEPVGNSGCKS
ncbi:PASTA domain-containing protein [Dactylosporangium vinaceum]|uniref:PASTA domain-containing protein n=1 Tax=Dactylosporangium vinaceum TaxID=53362 RepID=A0ABV5M0E1_9ACTN|nr:PASTA domain-containing protein [Dactylosporangium vinaceum]UAB97404.1 PASTA domain-containing protein [Dactylosporangium vinaceum]